jgi:hypothetical protein
MEIGLAPGWGYTLEMSRALERANGHPREQTSGRSQAGIRHAGRTLSCAWIRGATAGGCSATPGGGRPTVVSIAD